MVAIYQANLSAGDIKAKARALGVDLVGIADGQTMNDNPPDPKRPKRPSDITDHDADRVIVLGKRVSAGTTRIAAWNERHKYYNDELSVTSLEEAALELVLWLEDNGYPALIVPPTHVDPMRYMDDPSEHIGPILSLDHAAVEAGLGTLGLNEQLLTPEFGPRVVLTAVLSSVPVDSDSRMATGLCLGPECGRCLRACPGDVIGHWERDWKACDRFSSPHGFAHLTEFLGQVIDETDPAEQKKMLRSEDSFNLWQSILRGAGVMTGCRRCHDVCPVGADYDALLKDALDTIAEDTPDKGARLQTMVEREVSGDMPDAFRRQERWFGIRPSSDT